MSAIAALFNVPGTEQELAQWSAAHAIHHRDIIQAIFLATGIELPQFPLDPITQDAIENWAAWHQQMHNDFQAVLGIAGYDLLDVDWQDRNQIAGFVFLNASIHKQASDILGIG